MLRNNSVILTAAHCDWNFETNEPINALSLQKRPVRVGAVSNSTWSSFYRDGKRHWTIDTFFDDDAIEVPVYNQSYYPGFNNVTLVGDFLLLQLEDHVCIDGPSLTLNEDSDLPSLGAELTVLGLGYYEQDETAESGLLPPQLLDTTYNVLDVETCAALQVELEDFFFEQTGENATLAEIDDESMICTININDDGTIVGGQSACRGDSGGPVVSIEDDGSHTLMGLVSFSIAACGTSFFPDRNARVSFAIDWIKTVVCDEWGEEAYFCIGGVSSCTDDEGSNEDEEEEDKEDDSEDKEDKDD
jgi:Trypsin